MRTYDEFTSEFVESEQEIIVFITNGFGGATKIEGYYNVIAYFPVMIDSINDQLIEEDGRVEMLVPETDFQNNAYNKLKDNGIYKLLVSKCKPIELGPNVLASMNNRYLLKKILSSYETVSAPKDILSYRDEYLKDVNIKIYVMAIVLNREFGWFEGCVAILGTMCNIYLCLDEGSKKTAELAKKRYESVSKNIENWDKTLKVKCAEDYLALANEWKEDESEPDITSDQFKQYISLTGILVHTDDSIEFTYVDGGLFGGHELLINVNGDNEITDCDLAG